MHKLNNPLVETLDSIPILVYHSVRPGGEFGVTTVHPQVFREHIIAILEAGFRPITFHSLLEATNFPRKPIIITFDDGYVSLMDYAFPVLQEMNASAVVFMVTRFIGRPAMWDVHFASARQQHLTAAHLREMVTHGWEIGSHTCTHRALPFLNHHQLHQELVASRNRLMDIIGKPILSVAYPFGLVNQRVISVVREVGYHFGTGSPFWKNRKSTQFTLPRLPVFPWYRASYMLQLLSGSIPWWQQKVTAVVRWPAVFTPIYQRLFRPYLWR